MAVDDRLDVLRADPAAGIDRQTTQKPPRPTHPASRPPAQAWLGLAWLGKMLVVICVMSSAWLKIF